MDKLLKDATVEDMVEEIRTRGLLIECKKTYSSLCCTEVEFRASTY